MAINAVRLFVIPTVACLLALIDSQAPGQVDPVRQRSKADQETNLVVFHLRYADATSIADTIRQVYVDFSGFDEEGFGRRNTSRMSIAVDLSSNSLLVRGSDEIIKQVRDLIETLDSSQHGKESKQVKLFPLQHVEPDESLSEILSMLTKNESSSFVVDPQRKTVIAQGSESVLEVIEAVLVRIDIPSGGGSQNKFPLVTDWQLRIVWLVSGLGKGDERLPSVDLHPVIEELKKIDVHSPRMIAQTVVNVSPNGKFNLTGSAAIDEAQPCQLTMSGMLRHDQSVPFPRIDLQIQATSAPSNQGFMRTLCQLQTTISAPPGHHVVLGVTPMDEMTSVFVVQLIAPKGK